MRVANVFLFILLAACAGKKEEAVNGLFNAPACATTPTRAKLRSNSTSLHPRYWLATTSDPTFSVGQLVVSAFSEEGSFLQPSKTFPIHGDALAVSDPSSDYLYVVNRLGSDSIQVFSKTEPIQRVANYSVGLGSNAQDVVVVGDDQAYVSRLNQPQVLRVRALTGEAPCGIDMSALADSDGVPELARMARVHNELWVTVQRLDRRQMFAPLDYSSIAVVDLETDRLVPEKTITLKGLNPLTGIKVSAGSSPLWYVGDMGKMDEADGGVEALDAETHRSLGFVLTEKQAAGDILDLELIDESNAVVVVRNFSDVRAKTKKLMKLVRFNLRTGVVIDTLFETEGSVSGLTYDAKSRTLYLGERMDGKTAVARVRTFVGPQFTEGPEVSLGLAPSYLTVD